MDNLFASFVNMSIIAGWCILFVLLIRYGFTLFKISKRVSTALWLFVGIRLVFPKSITTIFSIIPSPATLPEGILHSVTPRLNTGFAFYDNAINPGFANAFAPAPGVSINPLQTVFSIGAYIWLIGVFAMLFFVLYSYFKLENNAQNRLQPSSLLKLAGAILLSLHWFNPLCYLAYLLYIKDIEYALDEQKISKLSPEATLAYSNALLEKANIKQSKFFFRFNENHYKKRAKRVLVYKKLSTTKRIIVAAVLVVAALCILTNPKTSFADGVLINKAWGLASSAANSNGVSIKKADATVIRDKSLTLADVVFPVDSNKGGSIVVQYTYNLTNKKLLNEPISALVQYMPKNIPTVWFDGLYGSDTVFNTPRKTTVPTHENIVLECDANVMEAMIDGQTIKLFDGMPIWNAFFADVTGDGSPDLCSTLSIGSGIVDNRIVVYDFVEDKCHTLAARMEYNFSLRLEDGVLLARKHDYASDSLIASGTLSINDGQFVITP